MCRGNAVCLAWALSVSRFMIEVAIYKNIIKISGAPAEVELQVLAGIGMNRHGAWNVGRQLLYER